MQDLESVLLQQPVDVLAESVAESLATQLPYLRHRRTLSFMVLSTALIALVLPCLITPFKVVPAFLEPARLPLRTFSPATAVASPTPITTVATAQLLLLVPLALSQLAILASSLVVRVLPCIPAPINASTRKVPLLLLERK